MLEKLPEAIGRALEHQRAGMEKVLFHAQPSRAELSLIEISSPAFAPGSQLPQRYTADGAGISPPLRWRKVPADAATLALVVEDADSPTPEPMVHAIVVDIDPREVGLAEGIFSGSPDTSPEKLGLNSFLMHGWLPPDPPPGHGVHRYAFQVFALAAGDPLSKSPGRREVSVAIGERAIAKGCLIGTYQRDIAVKADEYTPSSDAAPAMSDPILTA